MDGGVFRVSWHRTTAGQIAVIKAATRYARHILKRIELNCLLG